MVGLGHSWVLICDFQSLSLVARDAAMKICWKLIAIRARAAWHTDFSIL
jgi:hypothetical protein